MTTPSLRPVVDGDADFLFALYSSTRQSEMDLLVEWTDEQRHQFLAMQHLAQASDYDRRFPDATYDVVMVGGVPVGRLWVERNTDEIRLLDIAVLPEYRGRGIGTVLLRQLQDEARERGVPLRDSVSYDNPRAEALYRRLGFRQIGDSGTYRALEWTHEPSDAADRDGP
jgi:ribosomal protein S18 acetylase RimI-like enzyme